MNSRSNASNTLFLLTFALTYYCLGASFVESFVNYRTWGLIGPAEFRDYHQALSPLIVRTMVIPIAIKSVLVVLLLWFRPVIIPRWAIVLAIAFELINWTSSVLIQIPIQMQLSDAGYSKALLDRLIVTDWLRKVTSIANALLFLWLMIVLLKMPHEPVKEV
ncbi:MAG: hypothetical protein ACKVRN_11720 [Pyrinomonadaceae bacterium]